MTSKVEHYLVTVSVGRAHMHGYVMSADKEDALAVGDYMIDWLEKSGVRVLPVVLLTLLSTGADIVREILCSKSKEASEAIKAATNYHYSIFLMDENDPDDQRLMALH